MRIATFNVENLFSRPRIMNLDEWSDGKDILAAYSRLNALLQKPVYTPADKTKILVEIGKLGLNSADDNKFVILRQNRGHLLKRVGGQPQIVANGRGDWIGWVALKSEAVNEVATQMTSKVIQDVNADILAVIEAEDRVALSRFNEQLLKPMNATYSGIMLIDGNDERGIDVGIMTKPGCVVETIVSHVDDVDGGGARIFSRDCPEFSVNVNGTANILVLVNHFKSKGYGTASVSDARRKAQAQRARDIYDQRRAEGIDLIAVVGDLNDTPDHGPLDPLLKQGSDLSDISSHQQFQGDGRPGTYANGTAGNKIDYLLLSPALFGLVTTGGVFRKGVWGGVNGTLFPHYTEMLKAEHAASDHAALWADINI